MTAREEAKECWAKEEYTAENYVGMALKNATALGGLRVLDQILNMESFDE